MSEFSPVLQKNMKSILDTSHSHAHNAHKVVLRAVLESEARDNDMNDVVGVLKLKVNDPHDTKDSPLRETQTLMLSHDKRSESVSAKAAMRSSRSPSSRTFFIHAVDARNAQRWMLEVVLQIQRGTQSALVKYYEDKNAALRRDLRANGARLSKHTSEMDGVRQLLLEAKNQLDIERRQRRQVEDMHARLEHRLNGLCSWKSFSDGLWKVDKRRLAKLEVLDVLRLNRHRCRWRWLCRLREPVLDTGD